MFKGRHLSFGYGIKFPKELLLTMFSFTRPIMSCHVSSSSCWGGGEWFFRDNALSHLTSMKMFFCTCGVLYRCAAAVFELLSLRGK